jgi:DNA-binding FadR family transcriptional regulator
MIDLHSEGKGEAVPAINMIGHSVLRPGEQVQEAIKGAIAAGKLKSGEMLPPEIELARQFGVSRATIREALRVLSTQHLIRRVPGTRGGNFVQAADYSALGVAVSDSVGNLMAMGQVDFREVSEFRQQLEVTVVRLAAKNRGQADLDELHTVTERQKSISVDDPLVPELGRRFHARIGQASGNRALASLVAALHSATESVSYVELSPKVGRDSLKQHQAILRAIEAQDADAGETAIIEHLSYLRKHLIANRSGSR